MEFLSIYIKEAHPIDGWWLGGDLTGKLAQRMLGSKAATDIYDPKVIQERQEVASQCETKLGYQITTIVDTMDDAVNKAYAAQPTRLYLIGKDGKVVYVGGLGPSGFKPTELERAIDKYLANNTVTTR